MKKIRVLFPRVEAGFGHIMTMNSVAKVFEEKYGDKVEVIHTNFYKDTDNPRIQKYGKVLIRQVEIYNSRPAIGYLASISCELWGTKMSSWGSMKAIVPGSFKACVKQMEEYKPDVVFSTHWATNYYAMHMKKRPVTISYCPDVIMNKLFMYPADLSLISMSNGYEKALKNKIYNKGNLKLVPFLIRDQVFEMNETKEYYRKLLNLPAKNFTIVLAEGGYGRGKMKKLVKLLIKEHLPITIIPICGKNQKLYKYFLTLKPTKEITFLPQEFSKDIFSFIKASDLFCGKSGNMIAEPTFFGVPSIITAYTTIIERNIGEFYINIVHSAMKEFNLKKVIKMIKSFIDNPELLLPYQQACASYHSNYGAEKTADLIWEQINKSFPELCEEKGTI